MFSTELSDRDWSKVEDKCDYEAKKATGSAPVNIAHYRWKDIYIKCLELNGGKYVSGPR